MPVVTPTLMLNGALVMASRTCQAAVIECVDRAVNAPLSETLWRLALPASVTDALAQWWDLQADVMDQRYALLEELVSLHRAFFQRLLEVPFRCDPDAGSAQWADLADVIPLRVTSAPVESPAARNPLPMSGVDHAP